MGSNPIDTLVLVCQISIEITLRVVVLMITAGVLLVRMHLGTATEGIREETPPTEENHPKQ